MSLHNVRHDPNLLLLFRLTTDIFENLIHLFQGSACSLRDEEEGEHEGEETEDGEECVCACASVLNQGRRYKALCTR
jgi:hypothetical protein